jgi:hypothetical protein
MCFPQHKNQTFHEPDIYFNYLRDFAWCSATWSKDQVIC